VDMAVHHCKFRLLSHVNHCRLLYVSLCTNS
jgi:hypothetical protein